MMPRRSDFGKPRDAYISVAPRLPEYAALFAERMPDGTPLTLTEIGKRLGVTKENVRQIRARYFAELGTIRTITMPHTAKRNALRRFQKPYLFCRMVRGWLRAEGYFQCGTC